MLRRSCVGVGVGVLCRRRLSASCVLRSPAYDTLQPAPDHASARYYTTVLFGRRIRRHVPCRDSVAWREVTWHHIEFRRSRLVKTTYVAPPRMPLPGLSSPDNPESRTDRNHAAQWATGRRVASPFVTRRVVGVSLERFSEKLRSRCQRQRQCPCPCPCPCPSQCQCQRPRQALSRAFLRSLPDEPTYPPATVDFSLRPLLPRLASLANDSRCTASGFGS
jgi:hypothetical protein